jgi:transcriptional regulator with XRE-family HTH domain
MPVYSSHLLQYEDLKLGDRIRSARQQQGLTLKQLGARVNSSPARLSQVENDRLRLDLQEVLRFAHALDVPLNVLIPSDVSQPYQISRDSDVRSQPPRTTRFAGLDEASSVVSAHNYTPLADLFVGRHLEPVLGRIEPLEEHELQYCYHHEEEFAFALRGTLEFRIKTPDGECRERLGRGDCVYFRSDLPHCFRSLDQDAAESLHIFCSPSTSTEGGTDSGTHRAVAHSGGDGANELQRRLGERLRLLREIHGWSVARVARAAGLAERQVVSIERGARAMPVEAMLKFARAFGKPLRELMGLAGAVRPYYFVRRSKDIASIPNRKRRTPVERPQAPASKTCQPLVDGFPAQAMYPYFLRLLNVDIETLTLHEHHGQEFIYVLEGELELTTYCGDQQVRDVLRAGDSCFIDSTVPHLLRSWTRNPYSETSAEVIDVFWCPLGEAYLFDG